MKAVDTEIFNIKGRGIICSVLLDCTYLELIREERKVFISPANNKNEQRNYLIIGVNKPNGDYSEVKTSIDKVSPIEAKGSLSIHPPNIDLVPAGSEIKLLRYE